MVRRALPDRRVRKVHRVRGVRRAIPGRPVPLARPDLPDKLDQKAKKGTRATAGQQDRQGLKAKLRLPLPPYVYRSKSVLPVAVVSRAAGLKNSP